MANVGRLQGGIQKQPKRRPTRNKYPFLRVANVQRNGLDLSEVHDVELFDGELDHYALAAGDLLIVEGNGSASEIGRLAVWRGLIPNCVHQNHLIRHRPADGVLPDYVAAYWNSPTGSARVLAVASSTSGLYTLSVRKIASLPVPLPPTAEQRRIVAEVDRRLSLADAVERTVAEGTAKGKRLRQAILKRAFEGKLVPQDPNDEPASVLLERIRQTKGATPPAARRRGRASRPST
jgi:type I restriction enzyme S subunit